MHYDWQIDQLEKAIDVLALLLAEVRAVDVIGLRDGGDGWTLNEVLGHMRDFESIFADRIRLTQMEERPTLPFPDPIELADENSYDAIPFSEAYETWAERRHKTVALFRKVEDWDTAALHPTRGEFTLADQLALTAWHDMNHFHQIAKIVSGGGGHHEDKA
jgi:uncharacterized damage-inducible protein DinB